MASNTPFFTPSISSKSPTISLAAKGLNSSSPPVFSLILLAQFLKVVRPTPAGHDVCTFQVVVVAASALRMYGAATAAAATPPITARRLTLPCLLIRLTEPFMADPPCSFLTRYVFPRDRAGYAMPTPRRSHQHCGEVSIPNFLRPTKQRLSCFGGSQVGASIVKSEHCPARTRTYSPSCTGDFRGFSGLSAYPVGGAPAAFADAALLPAPASLLTRSVSLASSAALPE